ncbi:hypothetical protein ACLKA6_012749 [Drosophila palustris]
MKEQPFFERSAQRRFAWHEPLYLYEPLRKKFSLHNGSQSEWESESCLSVVAQYASNSFSDLPLATEETYQKRGCSGQPLALSTAKQQHLARGESQYRNTV